MMLNNSIDETTFYSIIVNGSKIYCRAGGGIYSSNDNGATWTNIFANSNYSLAVKDNNIYVGGLEGVYVSTDYGATWSYYINGFPAICQGIYALEINGNNIYAGTMTDLLVSSDNGANWIPVKSNYFDEIYSIAANGNNIFVGSQHGLRFSTDNGATWSPANGDNGELGTTYFSYAVEFIQSNIFTGTDHGVFMSSDNGASWTKVNSGLTNTDVRSITFDGINVYAGTNEGGVFKRPLSDFNVSSSTFTGNVFNDVNNNGVKDNGEAGLPNVMVKTQSNNWVFNTDSIGNYKGYSSLANDVINIVSSSNYSTVNPLNYTVANGDTNKNFAVYYNPNVQDLRVTVTNLTPARPGFNYKLRVTYENLGTTTMSGNVTLDFENSLTYLNSSPPQSGINGNTVSWNYSNLAQFEKRDIDVLFNLPSTVLLNTVLHFTGIIFPIVGDTTPNDNHNSIEQLVTGSFDPNEKEVIPANGLTPQQLANGDKLIYTVHFQNTGNDTAFNIKITDTLNANVDASTFQLLSSSHPCTFSVRGAGIIEFYFQNILLPDSNINLTGSNGFVKYAVKPLSTLPVGDSVTNTAYIYFDFNQAVQTNTVSSLIYTTIGIEEGKTDGNGIYIYPNPASSALSIGLGVMSKGGLCRIYDIMGTEVFNKTFSGNKTQLDVSNLAKGLYLLKIENGDNVAVKRFIKE